MKVILKNMGIVIRKFVSMKVSEVFFLFSLVRRNCVRVWFLLECLSIVLRMVFKFIMVVIKFRVLFMLEVILLMIFVRGKLVVRLKLILVISKVKKVLRCR